jgi:integrase
VRELDLHMHDHRARAADDAEDRGEDVADFLGHTSDAMARKRYLRREKVLTPNARIKRSG